jgi:hypothetical protein
MKTRTELGLPGGGEMASSVTTSSRVVVFIQENKTPDFYFRSLAPFGADISRYRSVLSTAPDYDQPHDRNAWVHYRMGDYPAVRTQINDNALIPFYSWLAKSFTFCDHHFGIGSNSTSGHLLAIGGQTPTLKNPPFGAAGPHWDMPSIFVHAERAGITWAALPDQDGYPTKFYTELNTTARQANVHPATPGGPDPFVAMAQAGTLPQVVYAWSPAGYDEHPPFKGSDPAYMRRGHDFIWRRVDALVKAGQWSTTTFILTYDDWGGYADHVVTPTVETVPDALHPKGFPVIGGSRLPLIIFGGHVGQAIDSTWHSHASIPKTILDLFTLPSMGIPLIDTAPSLASRVDTSLNRPTPPAFGTVITQPPAPSPQPKPVPPPPWTGPTNQAMAPVILNGGNTIPAPTDGVVNKKPPTPPKT